MLAVLSSAGVLALTNLIVQGLGGSPSAEQGIQINTLLNVFTILMLAAVTPFAVRAKRKDGTIADLKASVEAKEALLEDKDGTIAYLREKVTRCEQRAEQLAAEREAARVKAEELARYTAQPALEEVRDLIEKLQLVLETQHEANQLLIQSLIDNR